MVHLRLQSVLRIKEQIDVGVVPNDVRIRLHNRPEQEHSTRYNLTACSKAAILLRSLDIQEN